MSHPSYVHDCGIEGCPWNADGEIVLIGDHVAGPDHLGIVTAIYLDSVELSTGDQVPVSDLVLIRRGES